MLNEEFKEKSGSRLFELLMAFKYIVGKAQCFESNHFYIEFMTETSEKITTTTIIIILFYFFFYLTGTPL